MKTPKRLTMTTKAKPTRRKCLTVREVLRELRIQVRLYRVEQKGALDAVTKDQCANAIMALQFAIRFIQRGLTTRDTLQHVLDVTRATGKLEHYR